MYQQVEFKASRSATVAGWVGLVMDASSQRVLTRTGVVYDTSDEARFGARLKWLGRLVTIQQARESAA